MNTSGERFTNFSFLSFPKGNPTYTKFITCRNYINNSSDALKHAHSRDENLFAVLTVGLRYRGFRFCE
jgi:hypothetical protein